MIVSQQAISFKMKNVIHDRNNYITNRVDNEDVNNTYNAVKNRTELN
jgi:hypothetical protein